MARTTITRALSVKQPWATLLLAGLKQIEIRSWRTSHRGRVLIHAASRPDNRPQGWQRITPELQPLTELQGGILGSLELVEERVYHTPEEFQADESLHFNDPSWFVSPRYGFVFEKPTILPFRKCPGQVRFFGVEEDIIQSQTSLLLVSVRSASEAAMAVEGGAGLIDVKEPSRGSLGRADDATLAAVVEQVAGRKPVSAALGELRDVLTLPLPTVTPLLSYVKWGLSGYEGKPVTWKMELLAAISQLQRTNPRCRWVAVAYADWSVARSPKPIEVAQFAAAEGAGALLIDTWEKNGKNLLDHLTPLEIASLVSFCRDHSLPIALAGSLTTREIKQLRPLQPDWFAVRGAACKKGNRTTTIDPERIRQLTASLE